MRLDQALVHWDRRAESLRRKWLDFSSGIMDAISQEEMRICRQELDQQLVTNNNREESRGSSRCGRGDHHDRTITLQASGA